LSNLNRFRCGMSSLLLFDIYFDSASKLKI